MTSNSTADKSVSSGAAKPVKPPPSGESYQGVVQLDKIAGCFAQLQLLPGRLYVIAQDLGQANVTEYQLDTSGSGPLLGNVREIRSPFGSGFVENVKTCRANDSLYYFTKTNTLKSEIKWFYRVAAEDKEVLTQSQSRMPSNMETRKAAICHRTANFLIPDWRMKIVYEFSADGLLLKTIHVDAALGSEPKVDGLGFDVSRRSAGSLLIIHLEKVSGENLVHLTRAHIKSEQKKFVCHNMIELQLGKELGLFFAEFSDGAGIPVAVCLKEDGTKMVLQLLDHDLDPQLKVVLRPPTPLREIDVRRCRFALQIDRDRQRLYIFSLENARLVLYVVPVKI